MGWKLPGLLFAAVSPQGWTLSGPLQTQVCRTRGGELGTSATLIYWKSCDWKLEREASLAECGSEVKLWPINTEKQTFFPWSSGQFSNGWAAVGDGQPGEDVLRQHDGWLRSCRSAPLSVI